MSNLDEADAGYSTSSSVTGTSDADDSFHEEDPIEENEPFTEQSYNALLEEFNIFSVPTLPEPNVDEMWKNRMDRNLEFMSTISPSIAKRFLLTEQRHGTKEATSAEDQAATLIQRHFRGFLGRKIYLQKLLAQFEKDEEQRRLKQTQQVEEAELLIENHALETEIEESIVTHKNRLKRIDYYARMIQRAWAKYKERREHAAAE